MKELLIPSSCQEVVESFLKRNNRIKNISSKDHTYYIDSASMYLPKSFIFSLHDENVFATAEELNAFSNCQLTVDNLNAEKMENLPIIQEKTPPLESFPTPQINKFKFILKDIYQTYYNTSVNEDLATPEELRSLYTKLIAPNFAVSSNLSKMDQIIYGKLIDTLGQLFLVFDSQYPNYSKKINDLLQSIKKEELKVQIPKNHLQELGIIDKEDKIKQPKEFYILLKKEYDLVKSGVNVNKVTNIEVKDPNKYATTIDSETQFDWKDKNKKYINDKKYEKNTPYVLRNLPIFVCWKQVWDEKRSKYTKIPINPKTGQRALANEEERCYPPVYDENKKIVFDTYKDSSGRERKRIRRNFEGNFNITKLAEESCSWADFKTAIEGVKKWDCDGIGIQALKHLNLFLIDLDHVKDAEGKLTPLAQEFIQSLQTYTEYSPSGTGIHMIGYADIDENRAIRKDNVEVYSAKHFITLTGNVVEGVPIKVCSKKDATPAINELIKKYLPNSTTTPNNYFTQQKIDFIYPDEPNELGLDNQTIIKKCSAMFERKKEQYNNLNIFDELYYFGNWEPFFTSQSEADLFLTGRLKFFTTSPKQVDDLFRESALMRDKWDRSIGSGITYGMNTINYCFSKQQYSYTQTQAKQKGIKE